MLYSLLPWQLPLLSLSSCVPWDRDISSPSPLVPTYLSCLLQESDDCKSSKAWAFIRGSEGGAWDCYLEFSSKAGVRSRIGMNLIPTNKRRFSWQDLGITTAVASFLLADQLCSGNRWSLNFPHSLPDTLFWETEASEGSLWIDCGVAKYENTVDMKENMHQPGSFHQPGRLMKDWCSSPLYLV